MCVSVCSLCAVLFGLNILFSQTLIPKIHSCKGLCLNETQYTCLIEKTQLALIIIYTASHFDGKLTTLHRFFTTVNISKIVKVDGFWNPRRKRKLFFTITVKARIMHFLLPTSSHDIHDRDPLINQTDLNEPSCFPLESLSY